MVYDAGGEDLFVFRGVEEAFQLDLGSGGELLSARLNDAGWLAVTYQGRPQGVGHRIATGPIPRRSSRSICPHLL